ncbi:hypothetical protein HPB50_019563 [Hyalomma asiaticum]|uniref:Uncharacterized protein n=1 Tax=Hyalomma asiaticum TaxID=266040 RepID=A0ACB7T3V8_HYAAI|nr:hypothetical protein HPB50_019563 [Hyalomma asiaticum]
MWTKRHRAGGTPPKVLVAGAVVVVLFIVLLFLQLGGDTGEAKGAGDGDSGGGGDESSGGDASAFGGGSKKKTTEATTPSPQPTTPAGPPIIPIKRPESFLFCTLGASLESGFRLAKVPACDYFVYTDVFAYNGDAHAHDDPVSYAVFLDHYGISFADDDLGELSSQLGKVNFKNLYKNYGILTAGMATHTRGASASDSSLQNLKKIMKTINDGLTKAQDGNTTILKTVFLGVKLAGATTSSQYDASAMTELKGIGNIDLLILVSHLVTPKVSTKCTIQPLSRYSGTVADVHAPPAVDRLTGLVKPGLPFRVALSVTMSVYLFTVKSGATAAIGAECDLYHQLSYSELCGVADTKIEVQGAHSGTATAPSRSSGLLVFDTEETILAKMKGAIGVARPAGVGLVWAVYDVQNDVAACETTDQPQRKSYTRFRVVNDTMVQDYKKDTDERLRQRLW